MLEPVLQTHSHSLETKMSTLASGLPFWLWPPDENNWMESKKDLPVDHYACAHKKMSQTKNMRGVYVLHMSNPIIDCKHIFSTSTSPHIDKLFKYTTFAYEFENLTLQRHVLDQELGEVSLIKDPSPIGEKIVCIFLDSSKDFPWGVTKWKSFTTPSEHNHLFLSNELHDNEVADMEPNCFLRFEVSVDVLPRIKCIGVWQYFNANHT